MSKINILIVEDNEDHLYFIKKALTNFGYNFIEFTKGTEAYNYLLNPKVKPDIVLLDNILPGMRGLEILKKLKEKKLIYNIIFQTIDNSTDLVVEAMKLGATDFILKTPELKYLLPQKIEKILENYRYETEKLETEAKFKSILEFGDDDIWSIDTNYTITSFNKSFKSNVYDLTQHKIKIGTHILKIFPKENVAFWKPKYDTVLKGKNLSFEFNNPKDKLSRFYDFKLNPIIVDDVVTGLLVTGRDITARKKNEQELHKKNQLLSKHMNNTPLAAIYTDTNYIIKEWNTAAKSVFGYTEKEALGCNIMDLIVPKKITAEFKAVGKNLLNEKGNKPNQNQNITKSGKIITCNWYNTLIKDDKNKPVGFASLVEDITKQTQLESTVKSIENLTAAKIGKDYFNTIAKSLNKILKADYLIISKYNQDNHSTTSLAYLKKQKILPNITYDLLHTPCDLVSKEGYCFFGNNVDELFIKDTYLKEHCISAYLGQAIRNDKQEITGQLVALFCKPILEDLSYKTLMRVFADKIGAEMQRSELLGQLKETNSFLQESQNISLLGYYTYNFQTKQWKSSEMLSHLMGLKTSKGGLQQWIDLIIPEDKHILTKALEKRQKQTDYPLDVTYRVKAKGKIHWMHHIAQTPQKDAQGRFLAVTGVLQDVTKQKETEQKIKDFQNIKNLGTFVYDSLSKTFETSQILDNIIGIDGNFIKNKQGWLKICHPEDLNKTTIVFKNEKRKNIVAEFRLIRFNDKKIIWIKINVKKEFDKNTGKLINIRGTALEITERKKIEIALKRSEQLYKSVFANSPLGIIHFNNKGVITDTNDELVRIVGSSYKKIVGLNMPKDFTDKKMIEAVKNTLKTGSGYYEGYYTPVTSNKTTPLVGNLKAIRDENNKIIGGVGLFEDITIRKSVEKALFEKEQQMSSIYNTVADILFYLNVEGKDKYRFLSINKAFTMAVGITKQNIIGKLVNEIIPEPSLSLVLKKYKEAIKNKTIVRWEETTQYPSGLKTADVSIAPIFDKKGNCTHLVGSVHDITDRKLTEEALQKSNEALQKAQTIAKLGGYSLDLKTKTFTSSLIFDTIVGLKPKDKKTFTTWLTIIHPDDTLGNKKMLAHCIKTGEKFEREYRILTKDKKELKWLNGLGKIVYKNGTPVSFIGTIQDITDRKKIEIALKEKEQKLQEAHEITGLGTFIFDDSTDLFESSQICDDILGIDASFKKDIQGWISLVHPEDYEQVQNLLDNNSVTSTSQEFRIIRPKDKKIVWVLGHARKHFDVNSVRSKITGTIQDVTEQKINEETLSQYGYIIENSNTEILILDVKTLKFIKTNKAVRRNLGYSIKELHKMTPKDFSPNFSQTRFNKRVASLTNKDKTIVFTTVHKRKNGCVFPVEIALQKSTYLNKAVYIAFIKDISRRQRQEQIKEVIYNITKKANETQNLASLFNFIRNELATLIDTTNFFIALYEETTDLISTPYMVDEQDSNDDFPKGKSLTGYIIDSKKSLIGNHAVFKSLEKKGKISILGPPSKSWMGVPLVITQKAIGAMVIQSYEEENAYSQEDLALLELIASNISTVIKHKQDFEQIKLLNQALIQSPEAVIVTNTEGVIEYINPAFTNLSGYSKRDAIGKTPNILKSDEHPASYYKNLWETLEKGDIWEGEFVNKRKDGSNYLVAASISSVKNKKGEITNFIAIEEDITEKRRLERQFINAFVEAQEVEKQAFGEDLHDGISQILSAEAMYIDILIRQNKDRLEGKAKFLTKIKELNLSAIDEARNISHGLMAKQLKEQGLIKAIEIICADYNASRNIDFKFTAKKIKENDINKEIKTHVFRLTQEITTNIIRHAEASKAIIVLSKTEKNVLKIIIKDNGVGIDADKIKGDKKGAGLKNIERRIKLLSGAIKIDTAPNKGTCFTIEVPLVRIQ